MITRILIILGYALTLSCAMLMWFVAWLAFRWGSDMAWVILAASILYSCMIWLGWHRPEHQEAEAQDVSEILRRRYL